MRINREGKITFSKEENEEIETLITRGKYRDRAHLIRYAVRRLLDTEREERILAVRGLVMSLEGTRTEVNERTLKAIKEALKKE